MAGSVLRRLFADQPIAPASPPAKRAFSDLAFNLHAVLCASGYGVVMLTDPSVPQIRVLDVGTGTIRTRYRLSCAADFTPDLVSESLRVKIAPQGWPWSLAGAAGQIDSAWLLCPADRPCGYDESTLQRTVTDFSAYIARDMRRLETLKIYANSTLYP